MHSQSLSKISLILFWLLLFFEINLTAQSYNVLTIQGDGINIRENPNTNSKVVLKLNITDKCDVLAIGDKEKVGGKEDYWYKVKYNSIIGWVFGAFTSIRQEGRITITAVLEDCDAGDMAHLFFKDTEGNRIDFGGAPNNIGNYELCVVPEDDWVPTGNPQYVGKKFQLTYLVNYCLLIGYEGNMDGEIVEWPTIVELEAVSTDLNKSKTSCDEPRDYLTSVALEKLTFKHLKSEGTYNTLKEFINEDFVIGSNYEFVYVSDLNNDDLKEFFFCHFVPQHGGCEGVLISFIGNIWSSIFEFNGYPEYVWGIVPLQSKTNGYYDLCKDGVKYVFNGTEYIKE